MRPGLAVQAGAYMAGLAALAFGLGSTVRCTPSQVAVVAPTIDTVVCILTTAAPMIGAKDPIEQVVAAVATACGADVATVTQVLAAHVAAEVREGFVPMADAGH